MIPLHEAIIVFVQAIVALVGAGAAGLVFVGARQSRLLLAGLCLCAGLAGMAAVRSLVGR